MLEVSAFSPSRWRVFAWLMMALMAFSVLFSVSWIYRNSNQAGEYLGALDSLIALRSVLYIPLINWGFNQELRHRQERSRQHQVTDDDELSRIFLTKLDAVEKLIAQISNSSLSESETSKQQIKALHQEMGSVKEHFFVVQKIKNSFCNDEYLKEIAKNAVDSVLNDSESLKIGLIISKLGLRPPGRKPIYQQVYDCLNWIKHSFYSGGYAPTNRLLNSRLRDLTVVMRSLQWLQTEVVEKKLDLVSQREINMYFNELINRIGLLI